MEKEIKLKWQFSQSPQDVWEYLTRPELLEQWLGKTDFQPIVGHKFRFVSPYGNDAYCEVLEVKPYTHLSFSWQKKSLVDNRPYNSKVTWTLIPRDPDIPDSNPGDGTELHLVHNGFTTLEDLDGHEKGWNSCIKQFEELLRKSSMPRSV